MVMHKMLFLVLISAMIIGNVIGCSGPKGYSGIVEKGKHVASIYEVNWGPWGKISLKLKINDKPEDGKWAGVLYFIGKFNGQKYKVPGIDVHSKGLLCVRTWIKEDKNRCFYFKIKFGQWYDITIEQKREILLEQDSVSDETYFVLTIDGIVEARETIPNPKPKLFTGLEVWAVDYGKRAANATYEDLKYDRLPQISTENTAVKSSEPISGEVKKDNKISHIDCWGPLFKISLDLKITKLPEKTSGILYFVAKQVQEGYSEDKDMQDKEVTVPGISINSKGYLKVKSWAMNKERFQFHSLIKENELFNLIIEQKLINEQIYFVITINGKEKLKARNSDMNINRIFKNVDVFAVDERRRAADAHYQNLTWGSWSWSSCNDDYNEYAYDPAIKGGKENAKEDKIDTSDETDTLSLETMLSSISNKR